MSDIIRIVEPGLQAVVGAVFSINNMYSPQSFILHPNSTRSANTLPDIVALFNQSTKTETKLMQFQSSGAATLLFNLHFFSEADMQLHYSSMLTAVCAHPCYASNPKQALVFVKKYIGAISQSALDIVSPGENWLARKDLRSDLRLFNLSRDEHFEPVFLKNVDREGIWSQYEKLSIDIQEISILTKGLIYFTLQKWQNIDFDTLA